MTKQIALSKYGKHPGVDRMTTKSESIVILKHWLEPDPGDEVNWFVTTEKETLRHTEEAGYWAPGSVMTMLRDGITVFTPYAEYKKQAEQS